MPASEPFTIQPGKPYPLGATIAGDGVNFALFSASADSVQLLLYDRGDQPQPAHTITLSPEENRTFYYWHVHIEGIGVGQVYAYRVHGPYQPEEGMRFNGAKVLIDPYARALAPDQPYDRSKAFGPDDNSPASLRCVVVDPGAYDWEGDQPLALPMEETLIYEAHLRSLTASPTAQSDCPGTYRGLIDKIPYLQELGITAIELLPVQQFDEQDVNRKHPVTGERLKNYWGYSPLAYFAPHTGYSCATEAQGMLDEFRDMVKALHRAGIQVILDVVFNHTAESGADGPLLGYRGLENVAYYLLEEDKRRYLDVTGTGNTVNCNHSIVRRLIRDCLRYWVREFHIDGFRFDLASVLSRGEDGEPLQSSPILWEIESDPYLANTKLIAEAWDAAGLYQVGAFTGDRWAEWNGRFRDDVRRFVRGDDHTVRDFAWRMVGSADIFRHKPSFASYRSINFVTAHDGFTLADLVSYKRKHNRANGEHNRDGLDENFSWNCGVEGETDDPEVLSLRLRQRKNLLTLLMVARGTPMMLGGDEMGRTQGGNNNAYCQDNPTSWFDWSLRERNADLHRFTRELIALRRRHPTLTRHRVLGRRHYADALVDHVSFHGVRYGHPDWAASSHSLAIHYAGQGGDVDVYLIANAYEKELHFELPPGQRWRRIIDTAVASPHDLLDEDHVPDLDATHYPVEAHSVVVLLAGA